MDYIKRLDIKKIVKDIISIISFPLLVFLVIDVLHILGCIGDSWIQTLGIDKDTGLYYLLMNHVYNEENPILMQAVLVGAIIGIAIWTAIYLMKNMKVKLLIIEHTSLNKMVFKFDKASLTDCSIKKIRIDQFELFEKYKHNPEKMIKMLISDVDYKSGKIREHISKGYSIGYAGIANIPATFLLGFELGDENKKTYFHKYHDRDTAENKKNDEFFKLSAASDYSTLDSKIKDGCNPSEASKLLLVIELTHPIEEADYQNVQEKNDCIITFKCSDKIGYDLLNSTTRIERYADSIVETVARMQKYPNISEIKICISASGSFVFALGTKFSKTQNKDIVIYHFQNSIYPWGINVTKKTPVVNAKTK